MSKDCDFTGFRNGGCLTDGVVKPNSKRVSSMTKGSALGKEDGLCWYIIPTYVLERRIWQVIAIQVCNRQSHSFVQPPQAVMPCAFYAHRDVTSAASRSTSTAPHSVRRSEQPVRTNSSVPQRVPTTTHQRTESEGSTTGGYAERRGSEDAATSRNGFWRSL
jgi:hypothetical protein